MLETEAFKYNFLNFYIAKNYTVHFVEICIVYVKWLVISYVRMIGPIILRFIYVDFKFGVTAIGTRCILEKIFIVYYITRETIFSPNVYCKIY